MSAEAPPGMPPASLLPRWDSVVIRWALNPDERTALLAVALDGPVDDVATYRIDEAGARIRLAIQLAARLDRAFGDEERIKRWLRAPNAGLGGLTPIDAMASSSEWTRRLIEFVGAIS